MKSIPLYLAVSCLIMVSCSTPKKPKQKIVIKETYTQNLHLVGDDSLNVMLNIRRPKSSTDTYGITLRQQDKKTNYKKIDTTWTSTQLDSCIRSLTDHLSKQPFTLAQSATYVYKYNNWVLEKEKNGTQIDTAAFPIAVRKAWETKDTLLNLRSAELYLKPTYTQNDPAIKNAKWQLNKALQTTIALSHGNAHFTLDRSKFASWLSLDDKLKIKVDYISAQTFVQNIANQIEIPLSRILELGDEEFIIDSLKNKKFARMNIFGEVEYIINSIPQGKAFSKSIVFIAQGLPQGLQDGLTDFVEVNILDQKLWLFREGRLVLETSVVTGNQKYNRATPRGEYHILFKTTNKVLRGPGYAAHVNYWMPFYKGYGLHDANWRRRFGANIYETGGSHGCVNIPPKMAAIVYDNVYVGMDVIIR